MSASPSGFTARLAGKIGVAGGRSTSVAARGPVCVLQHSAVLRRQAWHGLLKTATKQSWEGRLAANSNGRDLGSWATRKASRTHIWQRPGQQQYQLQHRQQQQQQQLRHRSSVQKSAPSPQDPPPPYATTKKPLSKPIKSILPTHENIYTLPNALTLSRLIAAPVVGYLLAYEAYKPALALFLYAGITDLVDGWIARRWNLQTVVGTIVDPAADKALMTIVTVALAMKGALPVPLAVIILGRDILLGLSALYYRYISLPSPKTFARYWDFSLPSAEVKPTTISKYNTFLQLGLIGATMLELAMGGFGASGVEVMGMEMTGRSALEASWWIVGGTTIWSGLSYVGGRKGLRILSKK